MTLNLLETIRLYRGTEGNTVANSLGDVSPEVCVVQAALTSGVQVMTAFSTMALVIQVLRKIAFA